MLQADLLAQIVHIFLLIMGGSTKHLQAWKTSRFWDWNKIDIFLKTHSFYRAVPNLLWIPDQSYIHLFRVVLHWFLDWHFFRKLIRYTEETSYIYSCRNWVTNTNTYECHCVNMHASPSASAFAIQTSRTGQMAQTHIMNQLRNTRLLMTTVNRVA